MVQISHLKKQLEELKENKVEGYEAKIEKLIKELVDAKKKINTFSTANNKKKRKLKDFKKFIKSKKIGIGENRENIPVKKSGEEEDDSLGSEKEEDIEENLEKKKISIQDERKARKSIMDSVLSGFTDNLALKMGISFTVKIKVKIIL